MTRTAIAVLAALILAPTSAAAADNLAGQASVIDGDTLEIRGTRIRLWGIDASMFASLHPDAAPNQDAGTSACAAVREPGCDSIWSTYWDKVFL
jgi:endonuclease YncB( thermonuclease family)